MGKMPLWVSGQVGPTLKEVAVVVLGVIIALAANSWWKERDDRTREAWYLKVIRSDLQQTERNLERIIIDDSLHVSQMKSLMQVLRTDESPPSPDSLHAWVGSPHYLNFTMHTSTLKALMGTGDINLVQSDTLRIALIRLLSEFETALYESQKFETQMVNEGLEVASYVEELWENQKHTSSEVSTDNAWRYSTFLLQEMDLSVLRGSPRIRSYFSKHRLLILNHYKIMKSLRASLRGTLYLLNNS